MCSRNMMKRLFSVTMLLALGMGAVGCETFEGAGRDAEDAGDAIEDAADDVEDDLDD